MPTTRFTFAADAHRVFIDINGITNHHAEQLTEMQRDLSGRWFIDVEIPTGFIGSYAFMPITDSLPTFASSRERWRYLSPIAVADPANRGPVLGNAWGGSASVFDPEGQLADIDFSVLSLPVQTWRSQMLNNERAVWWLNTQPSDDQQPVPWVILLDGEDWVKNLPIAPTLLQMTQTGTLPPAKYLFISRRNLESRSGELPNNPRFWQAVIQELLPAMQETLGASPEEVVVAGQSFGGLSAVYAALHFGDTVRKAISQSGSFWYPDRQAAMDDHLTDFTVDTALQTVRQRKPTSIHLTAGTLEGNMPVFSQAMARVLDAQQVPFTLRHVVGGHDRASWFLSLLDGLIWSLTDGPADTNQENDN
ncbi:enterochelin esterase [Reinekea blandensis]|uniref:Enterochelin esterase n=1 Tax=Reinekea blandensis MED297 TaxID=314283 RepID=A4BFX8_9GAMM|nr:enterochelin esterase [Reinekea blandensis]EAR08996.1 enterochelin esterase [Reinekea sp. MED297] [Reinekea blandensis MED297]